ncbi:MAG: hypothetical protein E6Q97_36445 [Desulfurellales bacterium]|nr:MAG: hypothetical protein E6Q97_36445 [Desulfurellales bacterium]
MPEVDVDYFKNMSIEMRAKDVRTDEFVPDALKHIPTRVHKTSPQTIDLKAQPRPRDDSIPEYDPGGVCIDDTFELHPGQLPDPDLTKIDRKSLPKVVTPSRNANDPDNDIFEAPQIEGPIDLLTPISRKIDTSRITSRADFIKELSAHIPLNEYDLPRYIYRADLLDFQLVVSRAPESQIQEMLETATIYLEYFQGFPTFKDGNPVWAQMGHEPQESFEAFMYYLEMEGARSLNLMTAFPLSKLNDWYYCYFWAARAKAHDMYRIAHHSRLREQRIFKTENSHYLEAERLFGQLSKLLNTLSPDRWAEVDPPQLVSMLDRVAKLQRISAGLDAQKAGNTQPTNTSIEIQMRNLAQESVQNRSDSVDDNSQALLTNPEALQIAQELVLKVGHTR